MGRMKEVNMSNKESELDFLVFSVLSSLEDIKSSQIVRSSPEFEKKVTIFSKELGEKFGFIFERGGKQFWSPSQETKENENGNNA